MVDLSRDTGMAALEFELDPRKEAQKSSNQSAAQRLPTEFVLAGEAPLAPLVLMKPEPGRQERRHLTHDAVDQDGESFQHAAELQKNPREASLASHTDDQLGAPECSSMGQISSGKSGDSFDGFVDPPEDEADLSPAGPADEEVSTETHQLAMDMLHRFNELGDDAAYDDVSDIEDEEHSRNVEAAAAYLCKQLKQGCLDALEDVNEDEGDDWAEEEQKRDAQGSDDEHGPWRARRQQPLYETAGAPSEKTVLTAAVEALREKTLYGVRDNAFDAMCKRTAATLPKPNHFPPSLYAMKQVVGVEPLHDFEEHVCINECGPFPKLPQNKWMDHKDDRCQICDEPRFETYATRRGPKVRARKCFYSFGVERAIGKLYDDAKFCKVRQEDGARDAEGDDFWGSPYCRELDHKVGGLLWKPENGGYELGFDFARIYKVLQYSAGFLFIRSIDVPSNRRAESRFCKVVVVFPGPKEPAWIAPYFSSMLNEFLNGWKTGFKLYDSFLRKTVQHHAILVMFHSDTKARNLVQEFVAVNAIIGCGRCWFEGMKYEDTGSKGGTYFKGYSMPAPQKVHGGGRKIFATEAELCTHEQHLAHAKRVDAGLEDVEECGYKGTPVIAQYLTYVNPIPSQAFPLPVAHCLLLGLVKGFWKHVLRKLKKGVEPPNGVLPAASRKVIEQWVIKRTHNGGRPSANIVKHLGSLTMEDMLHITESDSLVYAELLTPNLARAWSHLRLAVVQCFREVEVPDGVPPMSAAGDNLFKYAKIVEEVLPSDMCTFNLHMATLHLRQQEEQTGSVRATSEFWVERGIQKMKACTTNGKLTRDPEKLIFNNMLLEDALFDRAREFPEYAPLLGLAEEQDPSEFKGITDSAALGNVLQLLESTLARK